MFSLWFELCVQASFFVGESIHFWSQIMVSLNNSSFEICFFIVATYFSRRSLHKKTIRCSDTCMSFLIRKVVLTYVQCLLPLRFGFGFCWSWNSNYDLFCAGAGSSCDHVHELENSTYPALTGNQLCDRVSCEMIQRKQETSHSHIQSSQEVNNSQLLYASDTRDCGKFFSEVRENLSKWPWD